MHFYLKQAISINLSDASKHAFLPPLPRVFISRGCCNEFRGFRQQRRVLVCLEAEPEESAGTHVGSAEGVPEKLGEDRACLFPLMLKSQVRQRHTPRHISMEGRKDDRTLGTCQSRGEWAGRGSLSWGRNWR